MSRRSRPVEAMLEATIEAGGLRARLLRSQRRTLALQLGREGDLVVRAPLGATEALLRDFLERRRSWVERQRLRLEDSRAADPAPRWSPGERLALLGDRVELRIERGSPARARLEQGAIVARVPRPGDADLVRRAVDRLYARESARRFPALLEDCLASPAARGLPRPALRFRAMRSRWGSCDTARRVVTLNTRLVRQGPELVRFVIAHELAHLVHPRHDAAFYGLLGQLCPAWRELRDRLALARSS